MTTLDQMGELGILSRLTRGLPGRRDVVAGAGDDCAVIRQAAKEAGDLLLTSDPVVEGVHFRPDTPPGYVGRKALARVLSDMAAMGGVPLWVLVNLVAPGHTSWARVDGIRKGFSALARRWGVAWVGGDISAGPCLELHVFCAGRAPRGTPVLRSGASPGDAIYVTGALGGSISGKHLRFEPRLAQGQWLRAGRWASAMMDLSDGLANDLPRMALSSRCGAEIWPERIPVSPAVGKAGDEQSRLKHALDDGEDYELLFTVRSAKVPKFEAAWRRRFPLRCTRIGRIIAGRAGSVVLAPAGHARRLMKNCGYEHFKAP
ncbi:MAG: thiamine-phosphate kinase [Lentisphaerae bacterium]|nr:thiamine-phosphate kinase [Lentisphaerota bacterium]